MGCLLRLILALALLAGLALAADGWLAGQAERRAGEVATATLGAPTRVELPGRPFVLHVLRGRIPTALLEARRVPVPGTGAVVSRLELELHGVRLSPSALLGGGLAAGRLPEAESGTFLAVLDEQALRTWLGVPEALDLRLAGGEVRLNVAGQILAVTPEARDGGVSLAELPGVPQLRADLRGLPGAPWVERVEVRLGAIEISGSLRDL